MQIRNASSSVCALLIHSFQAVVMLKAFFDTRNNSKCYESAAKVKRKLNVCYKKEKLKRRWPNRQRLPSYMGLVQPATFRFESATVGAFEHEQMMCKMFRDPLVNTSRTFVPSVSAIAFSPPKPHMHVQVCIPISSQNFS